MQARLVALFQRNKQQIKAGGPIFTACYLSMSTCSFCCIYMGLKQGLINKDGKLSSSCQHQDHQQEDKPVQTYQNVGLFATAMIMNKALVPVKVPVAMVLTGWIMRILKRRK